MGRVQESTEKMRARARGREANTAWSNLAQGREESIFTLGDDVLY